MLADTVLVLSAFTVLILPWAMKQAGLFEKIKRWYKVMLSALLLGLLSVTFSISSLTYILAQETVMQLILGIDTITMILFVISVLGIIKSLLVE